MSKTSDQLKAQKLRAEASKLVREAEVLELQLSKKEQQIEQYAKKFSPNAVKVLHWLVNDHISFDYLKREIEEFTLDVLTDKPYYVYCHWDNGSNGGFSTEEEAKNTIVDSYTRSDDERYECIVYDVAKGDEISFTVDINVKFEKE